jgi:hypothetical protein
MRYPLDFSNLEKGDTLDRVRLLDIIGSKPEGKFKLAALALARLIEQECDCTCKAEHAGATGELLRLRLLTDSEAAVYNPKLCDQHLRGFRRRLHLTLHVNADNLTTQEKQRLEAEIILKSRQYQAIRAARKRVIADGRLLRDANGEGTA